MTRSRATSWSIVLKTYICTHSSSAVRFTGKVLLCGECLAVKPSTTLKQLKLKLSVLLKQTFVYEHFLIGDILAVFFVA